jgi:hypothetical protein
MKPKNKIAMTLLLGLAMAAACYLAYARPVTKTSDDEADKLHQGIALFKAGRVTEARTVLTNLPATSAWHGQAKAYLALCRYAQGDHKKFLDSVKSPAVQAAVLPEDVREDLDYKQMDSLMYFRKFDEVLPLTEQFARQHPDSPRVAAMAEYQLASLYERGMKKLAEAAQLKSQGDTNGAVNRLRAGEDNLGQYLQLAADGQRDSYEVLTARNLQEEVMQALTALGGEAEAQKLVTFAGQEKAAFALVRLHQKIDADADANLRRMTNFLNDFPSSKYCPRVLYDMADVALKEAQRLAYRERRRDEAAPHLAMAHRLFSSVVEDKEAGVMAADVQEAREQMLNIYLQEKDYASLSRLAAQLTNDTPVGSRTWLGARLYDAYGLVYQKKYDEAATELDEILATGFKGVPTADGLLISAAQWRIQVAKHTKDETVSQRIAEQVQNSNCYDSLKRTFANDYKRFFAPKPAAK